VAGLHDFSAGGLALTLAEMAVRSGIGFQAARVADPAELFSESPSRVVLCVEADLVSAVENVCADAGVPVQRIGVATGDRLSVKGLFDMTLDEAVGTWRDRLPDALGSGTAQG
jgi:phosphoribosylformylglycinamidine synthase subunit PurL